MTFDYDADNDDELTIRVGDVVDIINKDLNDQEGWWEVCACASYRCCACRNSLPETWGEYTITRFIGINYACCVS